MSKFLTPLYLKEDDDVVFEVTLPFQYQSDVFGGVVEVPVGFKTDFASVPRVGLVYSLLGDTAHEPAVIHDWLYYSDMTSRNVADKVLLEAMEVINLPAWRRYPIYWGVRIGGWVAWDSHRKAGHSLKDFKTV